MKSSVFVIPISILLHLLIINSSLFFLTPETYLLVPNIIYYNVSWLLITFNLNFYPTGRKERFFTNLKKLVYLYIIYGLAYFSLFAFMKEFSISIQYQLYVFLVICLCLTIYRVLFYIFRRTYRMEGGNFVNVVVIGKDGNLKKIKQVFDEPDLGYRYQGYFDEQKSESSMYLGRISDSYSYIIENSIDQIYCTVSKLSQIELKDLIAFADNNFKKLKIIPDNKEIFSRAMSIELYDTIPVVNLRKLPLDLEFSKIVKRIFDVVFASLVVLTILSWLIPLLYVLIKLESQGSLFFKQKRHGTNRKVFWCYKFRSMQVNTEADFTMTSKNDMRVTRIGKIIRKTSIDELPQFFNVLLGDMSVVGPRPHMELHTTQYEFQVDKYLVRHLVKPGITGLAQIKGYRGEILKSADIINRIRYDIFYIEKWSLQLDLMIIFHTILNTTKGEDNAY